MDTKKVLTFISGAVIGLGLISLSTQGVKAAAVFSAPKLNSAEVEPTDPAIKSGSKVMITVQDTDQQSVAIYNKDAVKTDKMAKMGSSYTVKNVKNVNGKRIAQVSKDAWLNVDDLVQD